MAASVNRVILIGNVGKDPDVRSLQDGTQVVSFTLATSESWTDRATGERKEKTEWTRIVVMGNDHLTKIAAERVHKGTKVYVEGKLQTREWKAQDGSDRYTTEVLIGKFSASLILLDRADGAGQREGGADDHSYRGTAAPNTSGDRPAHRGAAARPNTQFGDDRGHLDDDEVPF
jgi:single-strand DNA-binding protein